MANKSVTGIAVLIAFLIRVTPLNAQSETLPANFSDQLVSSSWNQVVGFVYDANNRMYAWEKAGYVWIVDTNGNKLITPLIDIHEEVGNWVDHGLNGFALDPNFLSNGYFYLFYTVDRHYLLYYGTSQYKANKNEYNNATIARVVRYKANAATNFTTTIASSRTILIGATKKNGIVITHNSHSGGTVLFGTDGSLLISTGDGASYVGADTGSNSTSYWLQALNDTIMRTGENVGAFRAQMLDSYNGKILRIDPATGFGLPSNPFYDSSNPEAIRSKIWCLGLRNPFRMSIQPGTGNTDISVGNPGVLTIGDVGWAHYEEMDVSDHGGENFGWPIYEGLNIAPEYAAPKVNPDAANPLYNGTTCNQTCFYFHNLLKQETLDTSIHFLNPCNSSQIITTYPVFFHTRPQIEWKHGQNLAQTGIFNGTTASVIGIDAPGSPVVGPQFMGNASIGGTWYADNRMPPEYQGKYFHNDYAAQWIKRVSFDSNFKATAIDSFCNNMGKIVFLTVNPKDGCFNYISYDLNQIRKICYTSFVNNPPVVVINSNVRYGTSPLTVAFNGSGSYDTETKVNLSFLWNFGDGTATSILKNPQHTYNVPSGVPTAFWCSLTVTDSLGLSTKDSVLITVNNSPPVVKITSIADNGYFATSHQSFINLTANVSDAEQSNANLIYEWRVTLHHNNHIHPGPADNDSVTTAILDPVGCDSDTYYYLISLKVTDPPGAWGYDSVRLFPACKPPVAYIATPNQSVCKGASVQFNDSSKTVSTRLWSFPGGNPATSTLKSPLVTYGTAGTYNVKLVVTNPEGADSVTRTGMINVANTGVTISSTTDSICTNASVTLTANASPGVTYKWYKNGIIILNAALAAYTTNVPATYMVVVTQSGGCTGSASKTIYNKAIATQITSNKPPLICYLDAITMSVANGGNYNYQWQKGSSNLSGATGLSYTTTVTGKYKVVTNNHGCVTNSNAIQVAIDPVYTISASGTLTFCSGDSVKITVSTSSSSYTYTWLKGTKIIAGATGLSYTAKTTGTYSVIVTDTNGCSRASAKFKVSVNCKFAWMAAGSLVQDAGLQPNPASDFLGINFTLTYSQDVMIRIFDITGRMVHNEILNDTEGGENSYNISIADLTDGVFCLELSDAHSEFKTNVKFIKKK